MKLNSLVAKPQLIKCVLDDEDIVKEYGEPIEWWVYDRQPLSTFLKFAGNNGTESSQIIEVMSEMIRDEEGNKILIGDATLPTNILMKVIGKVTEVLGK